MKNNETMEDLDKQIDALVLEQDELTKKFDAVYAKQKKIKLAEFKTKFVGKWFKKVDKEMADAIGGNGATYYFVKKVVDIDHQCRSDNYHKLTFHALCNCIEVDVSKSCFIGHIRDNRPVPIYENTKEVKAEEVLKAVNSKLESQKKLYGDMEKVLNDMMVKVKEL